MVLPGLRGLSLKGFLKRLVRAIRDDSVLEKAAQLAFYFLFSLFPLLFFLVALAAYLPLKPAVGGLFDRAAQVMPASALDIVRGQVKALLGQPRPKLLTASLLAALWSASRGTNSFRKGLNVAYAVSESRSFLRTQALAIAMTVVCVVLVLAAFAGIALGGRLGLWLADKAHIAPAYRVVWAWLRWPITALIIMLVAALIYGLLPDVKQRFRFIAPGSLTSTVLWLASTWGFTQYAEHFGNFDVIYGSLGGVIVLLSWLHLTGLVFLLGGEINAVLEHASPDGKRPGARVPGAPRS